MGEHKKKKESMKHFLAADDDGFDDYCRENAANIAEGMDTNADGTITYEEAAAYVASTGDSDADLGASPGDSWTVPEIIEKICGNAERKAKKGLLPIAGAVQ